MMCGCILISWELQHAFREDRSPVFRCSPIKTIRTKRLFRLRWHGHGPKSLQTVSMLLQVHDSGSLRTVPRRQQLSRQTSQPPHGVRTYRPGPEELEGPAVDDNLVGCRRIDGRANGEEFSVRSLRRHLALRPCVPCASGAPAGLDVDRLPGHDVKPGRVREQQVLPVVLVMMAMAPGPCPGRTAGDDALAGQGARGRGRLTLNPDKWTGWPDPTPDGPACAGFRS